MCMSITARIFLLSIIRIEFFDRLLLPLIPEEAYSSHFSSHNPRFCGLNRSSYRNGNQTGEFGGPFLPCLVGCCYCEFFCLFCLLNSQNWELASLNLFATGDQLPLAQGARRTCTALEIFSSSVSGCPTLLPCLP